MPASPTTNPSSAGSTLIPSILYHDALAAIGWLERALGFVRHSVFTGQDGTVQHAELRHGSGMVMLGSMANSGPHRRNWGHPADNQGRVTSPFYLVVADCDALWLRAQAAGAEVLMELQAMGYGGRAFAVRDPEGYQWSVGEYDPWAARDAAGAEQAAS